MRIGSGRRAGGAAFLSASHFKLLIRLRFFLEITPGGGLIIDICSPMCLSFQDCACFFPERGKFYRLSVFGKVLKTDMARKHQKSETDGPKITSKAEFGSVQADTLVKSKQRVADHGEVFTLP